MVLKGFFSEKLLRYKTILAYYSLLAMVSKEGSFSIEKPQNPTLGRNSKLRQFKYKYLANSPKPAAMESLLGYW